MSSITSESLLHTLPSVLANDEEVYAICTVISNFAERHIDEIEKEVIYAAIDALPEYLLDILAKDFKVDWWSSNYSVEEKRRTLKGSWNVHRGLGTVKYVADAISALYDSASLNEWFKYGGSPYHYKVVINSDSTYDNYENLISMISGIKYYSNIRSKLDGIYFTEEKKIKNYVGAATWGTESGVMSIPLYPSGVVELYDELDFILMDEVGVLSDIDNDT